MVMPSPAPKARLPGRDGVKKPYAQSAMAGTALMMANQSLAWRRGWAAHAGGLRHQWVNPGLGTLRRRGRRCVVRLGVEGDVARNGTVKWGRGRGENLRVCMGFDWAAAGAGCTRAACC